MAEPLRVIRRVGKLKSENQKVLAENRDTDKGSTQVCRKWGVEGLDNKLMKPVCGGGRQSVYLM